MIALSRPTQLRPLVPPTTPEQETIYAHLRECVAGESRERAIARYRQLFIVGSGYPNLKVYNALERLLKATTNKQGEREFMMFLERCWQIAIEHWQSQDDRGEAVRESIDLLANMPPAPNRYARRLQRLRELMRAFTKSDRFLKLKRLAEVLNWEATSEESEHPAKMNDKRKQPTLGALLRRYPFLYEHCYPLEECSQERKAEILAIKQQTQQQFEYDFSHYLAYQVRRCDPDRPERTLSPVENPTFLSDRRLKVCLKQFLGKVESERTYRELARRFNLKVRQLPTFGEFKEAFYEYLVAAIDPEYGDRQFNQRLHKQIREMFPQCDPQKPDDFVVLRTYARTLRFLVVESSSEPHHFIFLDLITHLGVVNTIGLLLKIVLLSDKLKATLEKRFAILLDRYEASPQSEVPWLIKSLEVLQVAFTIYYGDVDLSYGKRWQ